MLTYRQQKINHVHNAQNHIADVRPAIGVCDVHQETRHTVVEEHLSKVLSPFFQVDREELLQPEGELDQVVPFELSRYFTRWPGGPKLFEVEPVGRVHEDVLNIEGQD